MKVDNCMRDWEAALDILGITGVRAAATRAKCPFCSEGAIQFHVDTVMGGRRFSTNCCGLHGDLVDLLAKILNSSREEASVWMAEHLPHQHLIYSSHVEDRRRLEVGQAIIESVWLSGVPLTRGSSTVTFSRILESRGMPFTPTASGHKRSLDEQYRVITSETIEAAIAAAGSSGLNTTARKRYVCPKGVYIVARLFTLPGQVSGLYFFTVGQSNKHIEFSWLIGDPNDTDAGFLIHPAQLASDEPLIVTSDPSLAFKASFFHAHFDIGLNPVAAMIDLQHAKTRSVQPLTRRPVVFWCAELTPKVLQAATWLQARVTNSKFVNDKVRSEGLRDINWREAFKSLSKKALSWEDTLDEFRVRAANPSEVIELIRSADLGHVTIEKIANRWAPAERDLFVAKLLRPVRADVVSTPLGTVEQRLEGWVAMRGGRESLICNKCWRVVSMNYPAHRSATCDIELLDDDTWHRCTVGMSELRRSPWDTLRDASESLRLGLFTADRKWESLALHISAQFNYFIEVKKPKSLGLDHDIVRTSRTEISIRDGSLQPVANDTAFSLLPLAGRELPSPQAVLAVLAHVPTTRSVTALVQQLTAHFLGHPELAVVGSGQYARVASQVLADCGFMDRKVLPLLAIRDLATCSSVRNSRSQLSVDQAMWATVDRDTAFWLAGIRPVVYLGPNCKPDVTINERLLQHIVVHLLGQSLASADGGALLAGASQFAWQRLLEMVHLPSKHLPDPVTPVSPVEAFGHWVSRGLQSGRLSVTASRPRAIQKSSIWLDRQSDRFWIHQAAINYVLEKHNAAPWDLSRLQSALERDPRFYGAERNGRSIVWRLATEALLADAVRILGELGRTRCQRSAIGETVVPCHKATQTLDAITS